MNRRSFIINSSLAGLAFSAFPNYTFSLNTSEIPIEELIGKGNPKLYGEGFQLRKEAYNAFLNMKSKALEDDIDIRIVSSYRSFEHQNRIWNRKYKSYLSKGLSPKETIKKIIEYSTIPGTSRHHWATEIDIIDTNTTQPKHLLSPNNFEGKGCFNKLKLWMDKHAKSFGFYLVYTNTENRKGFKYEPWHYSYKPLSKHYLSVYKTLNISEIIEKETILGHQHFNKSFLSKYFNENILDINVELL